MDAFHLLEAEWHLELYVGGCIGIVGEFVVVVETVVLGSEAKCLMPCHATLLPLVKPLELCAWLHEELHLHLLKLTHAEDELTGYYLVAEGFAYLRDAEWHLHATSLLHIEVVDKDALSCLRTQIDSA